MKKTERPMWKRSMLAALNYSDIYNNLYEIVEDGDMFGYEREESGYYNEFKELFDELSASAYELMEAMDEYEVSENWDDITVGLYGYTERVLGYDSVQADYFSMLGHYDEERATDEAVKRLMRLKKDELIRLFRKVMVTLTCYFDIKQAHDCLTAIVNELDYRGAILEQKNDEINKLYEDLTGCNSEGFDDLVRNIPPRMWVE